MKSTNCNSNLRPKFANLFQLIPVLTLQYRIYLKLGAFQPGFRVNGSVWRSKPLHKFRSLKAVYVKNFREKGDIGTIIFR